MNVKSKARTLAAAVAFSGAEGDDLTFVLPEDLSVLTDEQLAELSASALSAFAALQAGDLNDDAITAMEALADAQDVLRGETEAREAKATERAEKAAALAARINPVAEVTEEVAEVTEEVAEVEVSEEVVAEVIAEAEAAVETAPEPVTAAAPATPARPRPARITIPGIKAHQAPAAPAAEVTEARSPYRASVNVPGLTPGMDLSNDEVAAAMDRAVKGASRKAVESANRAGQRFSQRYPIAHLQKSFDEGLVASSNESLEAAVSAATAKSRLELPKFGNDGSLVAAGGWCAPSETVYDLCQLESRDGLISLPEINIARGGLQFTQGPDWSTVLSTTGFCFTEADDEAGDYSDESGETGKPCDVIPCPDFTDVRLDVCGVCVSGGNLQNRAYPELTARYVDGVVTGHFHRVATNVIAAMVAGSTPVSPTTLGGAAGGVLAPVLSAIELQAEDIRYKYRMARTTVLEAVFPFWARGIIRADLSRRDGVDLLSVTDAQIDAWFRLRGINAQFVYNWQNLGGAAATVWPTSLNFLIYPAGTFVKGTQDLITLEMLHDSTLNAQNNYTAIFTEEAYSVMKFCHESRVVTVGTLCPSGWTNHNVGVTLCA